MFRISARVWIVAVFASGMLVLHGCGGGGGGGTTIPLQPSTPNIIKATPFTATTTCPNGGVHVDWGLDKDNNGALDITEITGGGDICNGDPGTAGAPGNSGASTLAVATPFKGDFLHCPLSGNGLQITVWLDVNGDGLPNDSNETFAYVCDGAAGAPGISALVVTTIEPSGPNCPAGGIRFTSGLDTNGNGSLSDEVNVTVNYVCNGVSGPLNPADYDGPVFLADLNLPGVFGLYRARLDGGKPALLVEPTFLTSHILDFAVSADRSRVAFIANLDATGANLFVIDLTRLGPPFRVNPDLATPSFIFTPTWSPDSQQIAYVAKQNSSTEVELYATEFFPQSGTVNRRLSGPMVTGGGVGSSFQWSPDSTQIAYLANQDLIDAVDLYASNRNGQGNHLVSTALTSGHQVEQFAWAPDSSRIAYLSNDNAQTLRHLFSALPDGTGTVQLSGTGPSDQVSLSPQFAWAPDSSRVAYTEFATAGRDLFTALPTGGGSVKASGPMIAGADVSAFSWAPDSSRIAYTATQDSLSVLGLYTSLPDGTGNVALTPPAVIKQAGGSFNVAAHSWAPDSSRILYKANQDTFTAFELYTVLPDGTGNAKVNGPLAVALVQAFSWAPDSARIAYLATQETPGVFELYTSLPDGTGNVKVNGPLIAGKKVSNFLWAPDGAHLAYTANQDSATSSALYRALPAGGGTLKLSGPLLPFNGPTLYVW